MEKTIRNIINQQNDDLIFLTSEKNEKLSYGEFKIFNEKISRQLAATNVTNSDRAAIVLPNGPLMASSFLVKGRLGPIRLPPQCAEVSKVGPGRH